MNQAKQWIAILAICSPLVLAGCASPEIAEIDWGANEYEHQQRDACRAKCQFSAYQDGVDTECYGDCMLERGFFCRRDFVGECFDNTGTGVAETCAAPTDDFRCEATRPLPEEYRPDGSRGKAHRDYADCVEKSISLGNLLFDTLKETTDESLEKCGHLLGQ